jgi:fibronectin-binding autotransporter adhesin
MSEPNQRTRWILQLAATGMAASLLTFSRAGHAATLTWDAGGTSPTDPADGSGTWDGTTAQWSNGSIDSIWNNSNSDTAVFGNSNGAGGTVTLGTAITAGSITFNAPGSGSYIIGNTSANSLTLTAGDITVAPNVTATITSPIDGANGLTVSGGGTLQLGGTVNAVAYTGDTTINNSALQFNNLSPSQAVTVGNGTSTINFQGSSASLVSQISKSVQLYINSNIVVADGTTASIQFSPRTYIGEGSAGGETTVSGGETSTLNLTASTTIARDLFYSSTAAFDGTINIQPASSTGSPIIFEGVNGSFTSTATGFFSGLPGTFNVNGEIGTANPTVGGTTTWSVGSLGLSTTYAGEINGNNALILTGGSLTLTGTSTFTGGTQINGGTLFANSASAPTGTGTVSIASGATLAGTGTISSPVVSAGIVAPGSAANSAGTLTINNSLTLNPVSQLSFVLDSPTVSTGNSLLNVTNLTLSTGITLDVITGTNFSTGDYPLIDYTSLTDNSSAFTGWTVAGLPSNLSASFALTSDGGPGALDLIVTAATTLSWNNASANNLWDTASSNWTNGSSNAAFTNSSRVTFDDNNGGAGNYSVTLNTAVSPASITVNNSAGNYTISGSGSIAGAASLTKTGSGALVIDTPGSAFGAVAISAGTVQLGNSTGLATLTSLVISGNGTFDINNNHVILNYGSGPDPIASIAALLKTGYNDGNWNGPGGIISTAAQLNNATPGNLLYGLGYADAADPGNPAGLSARTIEIKYTLLGDANLNGVVDGTDFGIVAANFNKGVTGWDQGDFNYDNVVDGRDFGDLAANFNKGTAGAATWNALEAFAAANGLFADVPEPTSFGLAALGAVSLLARRRRKDVQS